MAKSYLNDTELNALIQQLSNKIKSHTSGSITDTNGVLDNPNNFATILAIVDYVKNITDNGAILVPITETITSLTAENGRYYRFDNEVNTLEITLPTITDTNIVKTIILYLTFGSTPAFTITANTDIYYSDAYEVEANKTYEISCLFNGTAWIVTAVKIFVPEPMNIITYKASAKLAETTSLWSSGLHTNAFNTAIKSHTFENGIGTIEFDDEVTSIGNNAFYMCSGLTSVTIPDSVTSIGNVAFYGCSSLTSITIGSGVTSIGESAFAACTGLTSVTIGSSVTSIGDEAFYQCYRLTSVTIPDSVTSIGSSAFYNCTSLTSITIGSGVTSIGEAAFSRCTGLTSITCNAMTAPTIQSDTFQNVKTGGTLTVPSGSSGYDVWMGTGDYYLGKYNWTKVEQ